MKSTFFSILALPIIAYTSCERQHEKPAPEKPAPEKSDYGKNQESIPRSDNAESSGDPEEVHPAPIVAMATLFRIFEESEDAFANRDYSTAVAKCEELLKKLGPRMEDRHEILYFQIGLGNLLGSRYPEAEIAFKECIKRFPKGEYTSRAFLGLGRACMMQNLPEKKDEALGSLKKAAADPKYKTEADLWISRISQSPSDPK